VSLDYQVTVAPGYQASITMVDRSGHRTVSYFEVTTSGTACYGSTPVARISGQDTTTLVVR
jgi:hypothetical protein